MANPRSAQIDKHSPTDYLDQLRVIAPALRSALESNLPPVARDANVTAVAVAADTTGALGDAAAKTGFAGEVVRVNVTAGGAPGDKTIVAGAPAAGEAQVAYDANGIPTVNFNAADAVTECEMVANLLPPNFKALMAEEAGP